MKPEPLRALETAPETLGCESRPLRGDESRLLKPLRWISRRPVVLGGLIGLLVLYPLTLAAYWVEFRPDGVTFLSAAREVVERVFLGLDPMLLTMAVLFVCLGSTLGLGVRWRRLARRSRRLREPASDAEIRELLRAGESDRLEFKSSARWDRRRGELNRALEHVVVKVIAGFLNGAGGDLALGVDDSGEILGLEPDYATLKRKDRDGYEQFLMTLVASKLGANVCQYIRIRFHDVAGKELCRITAEPADHPVYVHTGSVVAYFLRTGNATRELNTKEAVEHIDGRFPGRSIPSNASPFALILAWTAGLGRSEARRGCGEGRRNPDSGSMQFGRVGHEHAYKCRWRRGILRELLTIFD